MSLDNLTDRERFPLLNSAGRQILDRLRQHPASPRYNYLCGEKLTAEGLAKVHDVANVIKNHPSRWNPTEAPDWLTGFIQQCYRDVPFYRDRGPIPESDGVLDWTSIELLDRAELRKQPWAFVPDSANLDELIVYSTSGTTGNFLKVICKPDAPASYLPLLEWALSQHGISLEGGSRVSIMHVAAQKSTFTHCSVMSYLDFAGFVKLNLNPTEWSSPADRVEFIDDCAPEIFTGDPFAFIELMKLDLKTRPKAIVSSATQLLPAVQQQLESHFGCPVIDMISMNETGPVGFGGNRRHRVSPYRLFVEIIDDVGHRLGPGQRGEIVVSGGINSMMPLIRYRTGDQASLEFDGDQPILVDFAGRTPVDFTGAAGETIRSIDVVVKLYKTPLPVFHLHQHVDGRLTFKTCCTPNIERQVRASMMELFGNDRVIDVEQLADRDAWSGKSIQFTRDQVAR